MERQKRDMVKCTSHTSKHCESQNRLLYALIEYEAMTNYEVIRKPQKKSYVFRYSLSLLKLL